MLNAKILTAIGTFKRKISFFSAVAALNYSNHIHRLKLTRIRCKSFKKIKAKLPRKKT